MSEIIYPLWFNLLAISGCLMIVVILISGFFLKKSNIEKAERDLERSKRDLARSKKNMSEKRTYLGDIYLKNLCLHRKKIEGET